MTRRTNARLAGIAYLVYIATAFPASMLAGRAMRGEGAAAKLANIAQHVGDVHLMVVLCLIGSLCALVLGVTLWALTKDEDRDLAVLALTCRVGEGVLGAAAQVRPMGLLWLATASGPGAPDPETARVAATAWFAAPGVSTLIGAALFAVGSTLFSWLLLRGRMIPSLLAWIGVLASVLLVVALPLQLCGIAGAPFTDLMWLPMVAFEVPFALWLILRGVAEPRKPAVA
jgi:hypothetical protein